MVVHICRKSNAVLKFLDPVEDTDLPTVFNHAHHSDVLARDVFRTHDFAAIEELDFKLERECRMCWKLQ